VQAVDVVEPRGTREFRLADRATVVWVALAIAGALLFGASWALLQQTAGRGQLRDTPLYEAYADAVKVGDLPYRSFLLEYPPGALPAFLAPDLTTAPEHFAPYSKTFERWMAACGVAMMIALAAALASLGFSPPAAAAALAVPALSPLLLGPVILSRFDLWPAALTAIAVAALVSNHRRCSAVILGLAVAAKIYPVVAVPIALVSIWRRNGRRAALVWAALVAAAVAAVFVPFAVLAPTGLAHSFTFQLSRPLQIESLGAALLVLAHRIGGLPLVLHSDHGSTNIVGTLPNLIGDLSTACEIGLLLLIWALVARGPASRHQLVLALAAAVSTFMAFGKVFSPQYMIWLLPLVPLLGGRRGLVAGTLLASTLVLTHAWFPSDYGAYVYRLRLTQSLEVLVRDFAVVACALLFTRWLASPADVAA
jgi:hypothetical protein